ncbi:hypothetical protein Moror_14566 [Moniliophthora roreri MCA 2997]|nr:hypothetical protein Moror_14566 [Moniliophthora roreri MCA 2997]
MTGIPVQQKFPAATKFLLPLNSPPDVRIISQQKFKHITRNDPNSVQLLRFFDNATPTYINSFLTNSGPEGTVPPISPPKPSNSAPKDNYTNYILKKYMHFTNTVFNPQEFEKLPEHQPYNINIKLEEGTTLLFGLMYKLTPQEKEAVAEYIHLNLR